MNHARSYYIKMLQETCAEGGITFQSFSGDWFFCLSQNEKKCLIYDHQFDLNTAPARSICHDKSAASEFMACHGIECAAHAFYMAEQVNLPALYEMLHKYGELVIKKNDGTGGRDIHRASTYAEVDRAVQAILAGNNCIAVAPFYEITAEYRVVLLDGHAELVYEKIRPFVTGDGVSDLNSLIRKKYQNRFDEREEVFIPAKGEVILLEWRHNLQRGATAEVIEKPDRSLTRLAADAAALFGLGFASIDIINVNGKLMVLEINTGVMLEHFAAQNGPCYKKAKQIYAKAIQRSLK